MTQILWVIWKSNEKVEKWNFLQIFSSLSVGKALTTKKIENPVSTFYRLVGTGQNCSLVSRNRPVSTGFYKGTLVSFLVLDAKKVLYLEVYSQFFKRCYKQNEFQARSVEGTL